MLQNILKVDICGQIEICPPFISVKKERGHVFRWLEVVPTCFISENVWSLIHKSAIYLDITARKKGTSSREGGMLLGCIQVKDNDQS